MKEISSNSKYPEKKKSRTPKSKTTPKITTSSVDENKNNTGGKNIKIKKEISPEAVLNDKKKSIKIQSAGEGEVGAAYNPANKNYHPIDDAFWKHGEKYVRK